MHKKFIVLLIIGLFLIVPFIMAQEIVDDSEEPLWISYIEGEVQLNSQDAQINLVILKNDRIETGYGRIEISKNGNYIRIDKDTLVDFTLQGDLIILKISYGDVIIENQGLDISVQTPNMQDSGLIGSYRITVGQSKDDAFNRWNKKRRKEIKKRTRRFRQQYLPRGYSHYYSSRGMYWRLRFSDGYRSRYLLQAILSYDKYQRSKSTLIQKNQLKIKKK